MKAPTLNEKPNKLIEDESQLPRVTIENISASKEKVTDSKKTATQQHEHSTRKKTRSSNIKSS